MSRLGIRFRELREAGRGGLVTFVTAGDPDPGVSAEILAGLPAAGADVVELGMPFTDPMADGPEIERASGRALAAGQTMDRTLEMVARFRETDSATPVVLMGYYNPVHARKPERFAAEAADAGVDGVIVVDLPPEEEAELAGPAAAAGLDVVRLVAPTSTEARMDRLVGNASGFVYYVSVRGVTGTKSAQMAEVERQLARIRARTGLPIAVGFGIRTPEQAAQAARVADAAVVGSAIVARVREAVENGAPADAAAPALALVSELSAAVRAARGGEGA